LQWQESRRKPEVRRDEISDILFDEAARQPNVDTTIFAECLAIVLNEGHAIDILINRYYENPLSLVSLLIWMLQDIQEITP
jgi:hypothetical protein